MTEFNENADAGDLVVLQNTSMAVGLARAEIDVQIATAHQFPRSIERATKAIISLATLDEQTAAECNYALPRGGKAILGPSIRLAEIVQQCFGNNRVASRVVAVDRDEKYVEAEGVYHDLQTNSASLARVRRRIVDKYGKLFNDDMIIMTGNAACSIAKRNAIFSGVPKPVWRKAYEESRKIVAGDIKTLTARRADALKAFFHFGVTVEQVFAALDVGGEDDIDLNGLVVLRGMFAALKSGEETVETMFPTKQAARAGATGSPAKAQGEALAAKLKAQGDKPAAGFDAANVARELSGDVKKSEPEPAHDAETGEIAETETAIISEAANEDEKPEVTTSTTARGFDFDQELAQFLADIEPYSDRDALLQFATDLGQDSEGWYCAAPEAIRTRAQEGFQERLARFDKAAKKAAPKSEPAPAADDDDSAEIVKLLDEGRRAAMQGRKKLTFWRGRIPQKLLAKMEPHFAALEKAADAVEKESRDD